MSPTPLEALRLALEVAEDHVGSRAFVLEATPWPPPDLAGETQVATVRLRTEGWDCRLAVFGAVGDG